MNKKLSKKIILLIVIVVIVLFIWFLGISPMIQFHKNEEKLTEAAKRYFELNKDRLPTGERVKTLSLNTLYKESYLDEDFKVPYTGKVCSLTKSWVKVSRVNGEYKYYTYLDCGILKSNIDHDGPVITLNGDSEITLNVNDKYEELGVKSIVDNSDGKLKETEVEIKGDVDTSKVGVYTINYIAFDSLSNKSVVTRTVNVVRNLNETIKRDLGEKSNYKGDPENNYIYFSNILFRIYGLDKNNNVILISNDELSYINYPKISKWLDNVFYKHLNNNSKKLLVKSKYCKMTINENEINSITDCNSYTENRYSYIPSIFEINNVQDENSNFIKSSMYSWTANGSDSKNAFITKDFFQGDNLGKNYIVYDNNYNFGIKPMITIKGDTLIKRGDGTISNPYSLDDVIPAKGGTLLNKRYSGEYVSIGNMIWRIIEIDKNGNTRVISNTSINDNGEKVERSSMTDSELLIYNPKNKKNIGYFINNRSSKYINSSYFINHDINVPIYKDKIIYGEEIETKKYSVKFSAPNMYDMFSAHIGSSSWLVNSSKQERVHGAVHDTGIPKMEEVGYYEKFGVRLVGYVKNNIIISSGKGTISSPYILK